MSTKASKVATTPAVKKTKVTQAVFILSPAGFQSCAMESVFMIKKAATIRKYFMVLKMFVTQFKKL